MNNVLLPADTQRRAQIHPQFDGFLFIQTVRINLLKQFHPNQDIPGFPIRIMAALIIVNIDDVGAPAEVLHRTDFPKGFIHNPLKEALCLIDCLAFRQHSVPIAFTMRNTYHLDGRIPVSENFVPAGCAKHCRKCSAADRFENFPFRPDHLNNFNIFLVLIRHLLTPPGFCRPVSALFLFFQSNQHESDIIPATGIQCCFQQHPARFLPGKRPDGFRNLFLRNHIRQSV